MLLYQQFHSSWKIGNIRAAVRIPCSNGKVVPACEETLQDLRLKHTAPPHSECPPFLYHSLLALFIIIMCSGSFLFALHVPRGRLDGLQLWHVLELVGCADSGLELIYAKTVLINLLLASPIEVRAILLFALPKKSGAIGYYWCGLLPNVPLPLHSPGLLVA